MIPQVFKLKKVIKVEIEASIDVPTLDEALNIFENIYCEEVFNRLTIMQYGLDELRETINTNVVFDEDAETKIIKEL